MGFRQLIKAVQDYSGFSDSESQEALELMVESVAERLEEGERHDFASQLPPELQDIALSAEADTETRRKDIISEFMEKEDIEEDHATKQVMSAWQALKDSISDGLIQHIQAQLPRNSADILY